MIRSRIGRFELLLCIIAVLSFLPGVTLGQTDTLDIADILEHVSEGDADALVKHADMYLELALLEQTRRYTRSQALYVLEEFFHQYAPGGFGLEHSMAQGDEWWLIGSYTVRNERQIFRIYLRFGGSFSAYKLIAIQVIRS